MRLIKSSLAGLVLAGVLTMMPAAALAHGGGFAGGGGFTGGGGHGFGGGGGGHASGGSTGRGFSSGFGGTRGFSAGRFSGRGDHGRFADHGFRGGDRDFHGRRFRDFGGDFFDFGLSDSGYSDYYPYDYTYSYYNDDEYLSVERAVQERLTKLGYYHGPIDGAIGPQTRRAIRWFQSVDKLPMTGRIDGVTWKALRIT